MENMTDLKEVLTLNQCECDCHQQVELLLQNALKDKKVIREQELKLAKLEGLADKIKDKDQIIAALQYSIELNKNNIDSSMKMMDVLLLEYKAKLSQNEAIIRKKQDQLDKEESYQLQIDELKATTTNHESRLQANEASQVNQLAMCTPHISDFVPAIGDNPNIKMVSLPGCKAFAAAFNHDVLGGGWMVIQRRIKGRVIFENKRMEDYIFGFGELRGEFWLGLERMHSITSYGKYKLCIHFQCPYGETYYELYDHFVIGNVIENYCLKSLGTYGGINCDAMQNHLHGQFFSDWWTNTNGPETSNLNGKTKGGIKWGPSAKSIVFVEMLIKRNE